jgi:hypothetical protein
VPSSCPADRAGARSDGIASIDKTARQIRLSLQKPLVRHGRLSGRDARHHRAGSATPDRDRAGVSCSLGPSPTRHQVPSGAERRQDKTRELETQLPVHTIFTGPCVKTRPPRPWARCWPPSPRASSAAPRELRPRPLPCQVLRDVLESVSRAAEFWRARSLRPFWGSRRCARYSPSRSVTRSMREGGCVGGAR